MSKVLLHRNEPIKNQFSLYLILAFLIAQPFIDLITSWMTRSQIGSISIGVVVRTAFMAYVFLYPFRHYGKSSSERKWLMRYDILIVVFSCIIIFLNVFTKGFAVAFSELKAIVKVIFFPIVGLGLLYIGRNSELKISARLLSFISFLYTVLMMIATMTKTSYYSYYWQKIGSVGWFYAANELGTIISLLLPYVFFCFLSAGSPCNLIFQALNILTLIFCILFLATKAPLLSLMLYIGCFVVLYFVWYFKKIDVKGFRKSITLIIVTGIIVAVFPFTPSYTIYQSAIHKIFPAVSIEQSDTVSKSASGEPSSSATSSNENKSSASEKDSESSNASIVGVKPSVLLSNRDTYVNTYKEKMKKENGIRWIFGMGDTTFSKEGKWVEYTVEQDLWDVFFHYGLAGIIVFSSPFVWVIFNFIKRMCKIRKNIFKCQKLITGFFSIMIGLSIGIIAGHTMTAPAVAIYLCVGFLFCDQQLCLIENNAIVK